MADDAVEGLSATETDMEATRAASVEGRRQTSRPPFGLGAAPRIEHTPLPQWRQGLTETLMRVGAIEAAATAAVDASLTPEQRERAHLAARHLAESVAASGYVSAARRARAVERRLAGVAPLDEATVLELCEDAVALRRQLSPYQPDAAASTDDQDEAVLVVYSLDEEWADQIRAEATVRGLATVHAHDLATLEDALGRDPAAVVLDLTADASVPGRLDAALPPATVAVVTSDRLSDRIALAGAGVARVLMADTSPREAVDPAVVLLATQRLDDTRVLLVGDEQHPEVAALGLRIGELGADVITAHGLNEAWETVVDQRPNLAVLLTPFDESVVLARIIRADVRRASLPLVAVVEDEQDVAHELYRAGIDDVVALGSGLADITELVRGRLVRSRMLLSDAEVDPLTGLPNEAGALRGIERLTSLARRQRTTVTIAVVQVDGFGRINELHGRSFGDDVLQATARHLGQAFRGEDVAARLGASEFLLALYGSSREDAAQRIRGVADELRSMELTAPNGIPVRVTVSAGVAELPTDGHEPRAVRRVATEALRHARASGGDRVLSTVEVRAGGRARTTLDVVVVEGDAVLAAMLYEALTARGWQVECVGDGETALERLGGPEPSVRARVILLDADVPGPDGYTVLRHLADAGALQDTRVIVLSGSVTEAETVAAFEAGASDHVAKPFSLPVLIERVRTALRTAAS